MRTANRMMITASLALALAACGGPEEADTPMANQDMPMTDEAMPMEGNMPMGNHMGEGMGQMASAQGKVTAIDNEAGTITIDHGPVEAVDWPAMTMAFEADETLRQSVAVGDGVTFDFRMTDAGSAITAIEKQ